MLGENIRLALLYFYKLNFNVSFVQCFIDYLMKLENVLRMARKSKFGI